jgi:hypothetical protein
VYDFSAERLGDCLQSEAYTEHRHFATRGSADQIDDARCLAGISGAWTNNERIVLL